MKLSLEKKKKRVNKATINLQCEPSISLELCVLSLSCLLSYVLQTWKDIQ